MGIDRKSLSFLDAIPLLSPSLPFWMLASACSQQVLNEELSAKKEQVSEAIKAAQIFLAKHNHKWVEGLWCNWEELDGVP